MKKVLALLSFAAFSPIALADVHPVITAIDNTTAQVKANCTQLGPEKGGECFMKYLDKMGPKLTAAMQGTPMTDADNKQLEAAVNRLTAVAMKIKDGTAKPVDEPPAAEPQTTSKWPASMTDAEVKAHPMCKAITKANTDLDACAGDKECSHKALKGLLPMMQKYGKPPRAYIDRIGECGLLTLRAKVEKLRGR